MQYVVRSVISGEHVTNTFIFLNQRKPTRPDNLWAFILKAAVLRIMWVFTYKEFTFDILVHNHHDELIKTK